MRILLPAALAMLASVYGPQTSPDRVEPLPETQSRLVETLDVQPSSGTPLFKAISKPGHASLKTVVPRQILAIVSNAVFLLHSGSWEATFLLAWNMLLIGIFGVAVARSTATEFCRGSRTGPLAALQFSITRGGSTLLSAAIATGAVASLVIPLLLAGLVSNASSFFGVLVMYGWPLLFLTSGLAICAVPIFVIGWGLSIAAIGTDDCNGADSLSRGVNYFLSHVLLTTWYFCLTIFASLTSKLIGWLLLEAATSLLASRIVSVFQRLLRPMEDVSTTAELVLQKTHIALKFLPETLQLGAFLSGLCLMYVLLREKEDAVQFCEVDGATVKVASPQQN